jgi:hypothetical protein
MEKQPAAGQTPNYHVKSIEPADSDDCGQAIRLNAATRSD